MTIILYLYMHEIYINEEGVGAEGVATQKTEDYSKFKILDWFFRYLGYNFAAQ